MPINPQLAMLFANLAMRQTPKLMSLLNQPDSEEMVPNIYSALDNGYDPGLIEDSLNAGAMPMNLDYSLDVNKPQQFPSDGAEYGLSNLFSRLNPNQWSNIGGPQAALSAATFENSPDPMGPHPTGDPTYASFLGELLHDTDGSQDEDARKAYLDWFQTHGYR